MIWQHKIVMWEVPNEEPGADKALSLRQAEARYDAIGVDGWELVTTTGFSTGNITHVWTIWKRPFNVNARVA